MKRAILITLVAVMAVGAGLVWAGYKSSGGGRTVTVSSTGQQVLFNGERVKELSVYSAGASTQITYMLADCTVATLTSRVATATNAIPLRGGLSYEFPGNSFTSICLVGRAGDGTWDFDIAAR